MTSQTYSRNNNLKAENNISTYASFQWAFEIFFVRNYSGLLTNSVRIWVLVQPDIKNFLRKNYEITNLTLY